MVKSLVSLIAIQENLSMTINKKTLRPYQEKALEEIRNHYAAGTKKVLLHLATGAGKTLCFTRIMQGVKEKGKKAMMIVRGKELVDQASKRLFDEGIDHGVIMSGHWNNRPCENIQICSIDTLRSRQLRPHADLIVIDEAHLAVSESFKKVIQDYPNAYFLPVSATPFVKHGLKHIADAVVFPIGIKDLIKDGYLVGGKYYSVPSKINLKNVDVDKKTGDFNSHQLWKEVDRADICGDIFETWKKHSLNLPTIIFAINIKHSQAIMNEFADKGIPALHVDANSTAGERDWAKKCLENGAIKVVVNVGIFCTGVDIPCLRTVIIARPTLSYNLHVQQLGRATRPYPGKENFLVLDHVGNVLRHGFVEDDKECSLEGHGKTAKQQTSDSFLTCRFCYFTFQKLDSCPECGKEIEKQNRELAKSVDKSIELEEIKSIDQFMVNKVKTEIDKLISRAVSRGYKPGWVFHQMEDRYGPKIAKQEWLYVKSKFEPRHPSESDNLSVE